MLTNKKNIQLYIMIIIIALIPLIVHDEYYVPKVMNDEIGYLGNAAYMAGYDWSNLLQDIPYYSYGYSILISPLLKIFCDSNISYAVAIFLNGVFLSITFMSVIKISYIIFPVWNKNRNLICFASTLSCSQVVYSQYALAESIVTMCATISIMYMIKIIYDNGNRKNYFFLAFFAVFTYCCHQRTLPILIGAMLLIFIILFRDKQELKPFLIFFAGICLFMTLHIVMKKWIKAEVWNRDIMNSTYDPNDYGGVINRVFSIFSRQGFVQFMDSMIGKLYAVCLSYIYIPMFLALDLFKKVRNAYKNKIKSDNLSMVTALLLLLLLLGIGVCAIFHIVPGRLDAIVYTRYMDYLLPVIMMIGFYSVKDIGYKEVVIIHIGMLLLGIAVQQIMNDSELSSFIVIQTPLIGFLRIREVYYLTALTVISICYLIWIFVKSKKNVSYHMKGICIIAYIIASIYMGTVVADDFANNWVMNLQARKSISNLGTVIREECSENEIVYLLKGDNYLGTFYGGALQTQIPSHEFSYIIDDEWKDTLNYVVITNNKSELEIVKGYDVMYEDELFKLLKK